MLLRSPPRRLHLLRPRHLRVLSNAAPAVAPPTLTTPPLPADWTEVPISSVEAVTLDFSLYQVSLDLSSHPSLLASHVAAGQYLHFRLPYFSYPIFLGISSPPPASAPAGSFPKSFDFLVPRIRHPTPNTNEHLLSYSPGELISVGSNAVGRGFEVTRIADAHEVLLFAYGYGIGPIRSFIESGFCENENIDVSLFYGASNLRRMAYSERFNDWKSRGIKIIPVLANGGPAWNGERGYVHNAFRRTKKVVNPSSTGAILCGRKKMYEEVTKALVADGMSEDRILTLRNRLWAAPGFEDL